MDDTPYPKRPLRRRLLSLLGYGLIFLGLITLPVYIASVAKNDSYLPFHVSQPPLPGTKINQITPSPQPSKEFSFHLPVLTYHYIRTVADPQADALGFRLSVTPNDFDAQMKYLVDHNYKTINPEDLARALDTKTALPNKSILLTFDDGYMDFYTEAFPILKKYNLQASIYVVTDFMQDKQGRFLTWDQLRELEDSGLISIGSHTQNHVNVTKHPKAELEITKSKQELEAFLGHKVISFVYPGGTYDDISAGYVKKAGYEIAFTTQIGTQMVPSQRNTLPRVRVSGGLPIDQFHFKLENIKVPD
jgi:peptidoglycan/xylan/chitin deacetylase (PgdA/CDA1 family)